MKKISLDGAKMKVIETSPNGVVNQDTVFQFTQHGNMVTAIYCGGQIKRGLLVGLIDNNKLCFSYCQLQENGKLDNGFSNCDLYLSENGKIRIMEHFEWNSRDNETGINVMEEL